MAQVTKELKDLKCVHGKGGGGRGDNLSPALRKAATALQKNQDIIIKMADKGGNTVMMDRPLYIEMCHRMLKNKEWYIGSDMEAFKRANSNLLDLILAA